MRAYDLCTKQFLLTNNPLITGFVQIRSVYIEYSIGKLFQLETTMNEKLDFQVLPKLRAGDKVAILSPSYAASGHWPHIHELGLQRLREVFLLEPVVFPATTNLAATNEEKAADLIAAFLDPTD